MKELKLSTKFLLASVLILVIFCLASIGILFQAQSLQARQEMDQLLKNETLALSALVNTTKTGSFDFEMSPFFLSQYSEHNPNGFFRFVDLNGKGVIKESSGAPLIQCEGQGEGGKTIKVSGRDYRVKALKFHPEIDGGSQAVQDFALPSICLVVGLDQAPYRAMITHTLMVSVPALMVIFILLISIMFILVRRLTRDLSTLTNSLTTVDFSGTHAFPVLFTASTPEVKAVVEKLEGLHAQAAEVYREMWLFLGRAAHQIKTPVTAMQAILDVLLRKERSKEELLAGLEDVKSAAALLSILTKKLISSSRISYQELLATELIDLQHFFSVQIKMFNSLAEQRKIALCVKSTLPIVVSANIFLLTELFGNIIENAIFYSPEGRNAEVSVSWRIEGQSVIVSISDQGIGFPDNIKKDFCKAFVRGAESLTPGAGLGLSVAKKSAQLLGGDIILRSTSNLGSEVEVVLPLTT